ncbi:MAG: hypothetical protein NDJ90_15140 [Oligoflexia bacterium]|nr:hypothetical protein [Oligoflexia bacterium]
MTQSHVSPRDFELLKKEVEALGDSVNKDRLDLVADADKLRLEIEALRTALQRMSPEFGRLYTEAYSDLVQNFNPEAQAG